jgi:hypothetical protein
VKPLPSGGRLFSFPKHLLTWKRSVPPITVGGALRFRGVASKPQEKVKMGNDVENGKNEKLGFIPPAKIVGIVGAKLWAEHQKNAAALNSARETVSKSKEQVREALVKKLHLDPTNLDFYVTGKDEMVIIRRQKERRQKAGLADLSAASA